MKKLLFILTVLFPLFVVGQADSATNADDDLLLEVFEEAPSYPGGTDSMMIFIRNNIVYPDSVYKKGLQGRVIVQFIVETDGSVSNVNAVKTFDEACGKEAVRVVKLMKWNPGKQRGKAVRTRVSVPISFKLE